MSGDVKGRHSKAVEGAQRYRARHAARRRSHLVPVATATGALALAAIAVSSAPGAQAQTLPSPGSQRPAIVSTLSTSAHRADTVWYHTVAGGETLSVLAARYYGNPALWPALWWVNKAKIANPNALPAGLVIKIDPWHPAYGWLTAAADRAIPPPPAPVVVMASRGSGRAVRAAPAYRNVSYSAPAASYSGGTPGGSFGACVVARESGGNSQVMNSTGHYGLYQFSESTWIGYGGSAASFGHASVGEQQRVFSNALAQGGQSNWSPYDGC